MNIRAAHLSITIVAVLVCGLLAGSAIAAPTDSDFAHVVELAAGTYTKAAVDSRIAAAGTGSVLVRPAPGATVTIQWGGAQGSPAAMPRQGLYYYGMNFTGNVGMTQGSTFDTMISSDAAPGMFQSAGPGGFTVRNSVLSGGRGTKQADGCVGNVFSQMTFSGDDGVTLEGNTFRNFANRAGSDCGPDHSEALYLGESISNWVIRDNTFTNNGSTGHIFFTWWYCGGGYASRCAHQNVCIEGNDFGPTWGAYFDIDARNEFPDSMSVYIDPAQNAGLATKAQAWERPCPDTTPQPAPEPEPEPTPPPAEPAPEPEPTPPPAAPAPTPEGSASVNVVEISGTLSPSQLTSMINGQPAGAVSVRPSAGQTATVSGDFRIPRANVTIDDVTFTGTVTFGPSSNGAKLLNSRAKGMDIFGADDVVMRGNYFDGKGQDTQNLIWDDPAGSYPERFIIENNTFTNFYGSPSDHSEALYVGWSDYGLIRGNTFTNNGSTAHVFFTYFGETADPSRSYPRNTCVIDNTWGPTVTAYFDLNFRSEVPLSSGVAIDPAQRASTTNPEFNRSCTWTLPPVDSGSSNPPTTPPPTTPAQLEPPVLLP